jgi:predicted naringenin-chalcone synthase
MYLSSFKSSKPQYTISQADGLKWLAEAHSRESSEVSVEMFQKLLARYGCGPDKINQRGTFLSDFTHTDWSKMQIFGSNEANQSIDNRQLFYKNILLNPVKQLYEEDRNAEFSNWIHVTCTGYSSPSLVQTLISKRGWGNSVQAMHAYHMGCYASIPALRMARGQGESEVLHTELCTLHLDPKNHEPEQLVIQTLFADGVIRYRVGEKKPNDGYQIEELKEVIAPDSLSHMTWDVSGQGFRMTLSREVPKLLQSTISDVVKKWRSSNCVYAIHPGGPRVIDSVKEALGLSEEQVFLSREILRLHGNMSSATLPHIWQKMLSEISSGTPVISLAFGPGLTIAASHMRKI